MKKYYYKINHLWKKILLCVFTVCHKFQHVIKKKIKEKYSINVSSEDSSKTIDVLTIKLSWMKKNCMWYLVCRNSYKVDWKI